jgi:hypothetical protein
MMEYWQSVIVDRGSCRHQAHEFDDGISIQPGNQQTFNLGTFVEQQFISN